MERFAGPDDVRAVEAVPLEERIPVRTIDAMLRVSAARAPDDPALIWLPDGRAGDRPETVTFAELEARIIAAANLFHAHGVRPDAAVSILLPNLPETHYALWGGSLAGAANPVNPLLRPEQIAAIMAAAGSRVLVTGGPGTAFDVTAKAAAVRALYPALETVIAVGAAMDGAVPFTAGCAGQPGDRLVSGRCVSGDDVSVYFHTGGTTGTPKLAQQTHWNQVFMAWTAGFVLGLTREDRILTGLPLFHANAAVATGLGGIYWGAASILTGQQGYRDKAMMADFWGIVARHRATLFSAVPTILAGLLDILPAAHDIASLRFAMCGAAPMPVPLFEAFEAKTGLRILELYGMTEGAALSTANPRDGERRIGSIGLRLPYQGVRPAILDEEGAYVRDCAGDEPGNLLLSGPNLFPGYRQAERNAGIWPLPGWLDSGDLARRDPDGYVWLLGRAKDLIIRAGHNIDPAMIEEALHRHPEVELAAAVGRPDAYAGEVPVAYVALTPGANVTAEKLREFARETVAERPAAPAEVIILDAIPVTAVGKIFKPALRRDAAERAIAAALDGMDAVVEVILDDRRGMIAHVRCPAGSGEMSKAALAGFAIMVEIEETA
ncbi:MAG: acyl-CoA synthetase [Sphingomonas sp.]|nr:acyl-CoA synthetase [Sphingomonas sp.]